MDPLLQALRSRGLLVAEFYGSTKLRWEQLGTPPPGAGRDFLSSRRDVVSAVALSHPDAVHLVHGFRYLSSVATQEFRKLRRHYFVIFEWLKPRAAYSPIRLARRTLYADTVKGAAGLLAISSLAANSVAQLGANPQKILPFIYLSPAATSDRAVRSTTVTYCGRAIARKGLSLLSRALPPLLVGRKDFCFQFIGSGPEAQEFRQALESASVPHVWSGALSSEEVTEALQKTSVLVLPSVRWEGWGYVVSEALACGSLSVVSDVVGSGEIILPNRTGFVFEDGNIESLTHALRCAITLASTASGQDAVFAELQHATREAAVEYLIEATHAALGGSSVPPAPWLQVIRRRGGNTHTDRWDSLQ
jgi:glycosyltransferase involved in cell wall biosynthesis